MSELEKRRQLAGYLLAAATIYLLTYFMTYKESTLAVSSDVVTHMQHALSLDRVLKLSHNGWHLACWIVYACFPIDITTAAAITTACFNAVSAVLVIWLLSRYIRFDYSKKGSVVIPALISVISLTAGPLYLRFFNVNYYLGQSSPNAWHNPTSIAARPFALLVTVLTIDYWEIKEDERIRLFGKERKKAPWFQLLLTVLLAYGTLIKPSFLMIYLPSCGLILLARLIRSKGKTLIQLILQHLYFIPALFILLWQYIYIYFVSDLAKSEKASGIAIDFFAVAKLYTKSVAGSFLLKLAFPLLVIIIWRKVLFKDKLFRLVFLDFLWGLAITWTFTETGYRAKHGNFGWGNMLGSSILWIFCVIFFAVQLIGWLKDRGYEQEGIRKKLAFALPGAVLLWHLAAGISYYFVLLHNMNSQL